MLRKILYESLEDGARALDDSYRHGEDVDDPEGVRWIEVSDTLAKHIADDLRLMATILKGLD